ncbi:MAG: LysR substrate-binding domain-containing protein [Candidatus Cryptobacteroides sp.]
MELRHLQAFVRLTETLNFSSAANDLCITQSTLSATIRQLEDSLGTELFIRNSHGVVITEAGEQLLPFALETLHQAENCVSRIQDLNHLRCGQLRIGLSHSFSSLLVEALLEFNRNYPGVDVQVYYKTLPELMELLISHDLDLVLSYKPSVVYPMVESHVILRDSLSMVVSRDNPLASLESVELEDLQKYRLVLPSTGMQVRILLDRLCRERGFQLHPVAEFNLITPILMFLNQSNLATVVATGSVPQPRQFKEIPLKGTEDMLAGSYHFLKGAYRKKSAEEFVRILCENDTVRQYGMA